MEVVAIILSYLISVDQLDQLWNQGKHSRARDALKPNLRVHVVGLGQQLAGQTVVFDPLHTRAVYVPESPLGDISQSLLSTLKESQRKGEWQVDRHGPGDDVQSKLDATNERQNRENTTGFADQRAPRTFLVINIHKIPASHFT